MGDGISYNDVLKFCAEVSGGSKYNGSLILSEIEINELDHLLCLDNHYFHVIKCPEFKICYISNTITDVLGYDAGELTLKKMYSLIHPDDFVGVLKSTKKMLAYAYGRISELVPLRNVLSMEYRIKHKKGFYKKIFSQNCIFNVGPGLKEFKAISFNTDISFYHSYIKSDSEKIGVSCKDELNLPNRNINFTGRELEIIKLMALGKSSLQIGDELHISKNTVDTHRRKMLSKSRLCNSTELIAFAMVHNLFKEE